MITELTDYNPKRHPDYVPPPLIHAEALRGDLSHIWGDAANIYGDASGIWGNVSDIRGDVSEMTGSVQHIHGDVTGLVGSIIGLTGDATGLKGVATGLFANMSAAGITDEERRQGFNLRTTFLGYAEFLVLEKHANDLYLALQELVNHTSDYVQQNPGTENDVRYINHVIKKSTDLLKIARDEKWEPEYLKDL